MVDLYAFLTRHVNFKVKFKFNPLIISLVSGIWLTNAMATPLGGTLPGSASAGPVGKALQTQEQKPSTQQAPQMNEEPLPEPPSQQDKEIEKIKFQLNGIVLDGNKIFPTRELALIYKDQLHHTITVGELFIIVKRITNYYRNNGYILSQALLPPQHITGGVVTIKIVEGFIDHVALSGKGRGARRQVLAFGKKIKKNPPLKIHQLEKYLLLANELPGTDVRSVLGASKTKPTAADLTLVVNNNPVNGYLSYDNYGTQYLGPQQITGNVGFNSIFISGDSTQASMTKTAKGDELTYRDFNYTIPLNAEGDRFNFGSTYVRTHPAFLLRTLKIQGTNKNAYTSFSFPMIRTLTQSLTIQLNMNYLDSQTTFFGIPLYTDHIRSIGMGMNYNISDAYRGSNTMSAGFRHGLPILGYTKDTSLTALTSRAGGRADYSKIDFQIGRLQGIKNTNFSVYGQFKGQYALNPLLTYEQFSFGGNQLGRGYDVAEILGDSGIAGSIELRYDLFLSRIVQTLEFYTYYDAGIIWNHNPALRIGIADTRNGTSTGLGLRFYLNKYVSGNIMWTQVLTKPIASEELVSQGKRPRVFFSLLAAFP